MQLQLLKPFLRRRKAKPTSVCMKEGANEGKNVQGRTKPRNFTHPEEPMVSRLSVLSWGKSPDPGVASLEPRFHHPLLVQASFPGGHPQTPGLASLEPLSLSFASSSLLSWRKPQTPPGSLRSNLQLRLLGLLMVYSTQRQKHVIKHPANKTTAENRKPSTVYPWHLKEKPLRKLNNCNTSSSVP
jgi:hypothetical protein